MYINDYVNNTNYSNIMEKYITPTSKNIAKYGDQCPSLNINKVGVIKPELNF